MLYKICFAFLMLEAALSLRKFHLNLDFLPLKYITKRENKKGWKAHIGTLLVQCGVHRT